MTSSISFCIQGKEIIAAEAAAVLALEKNLGDDFNKACELILACEGHVIVVGMGKSGHIARKIAATLASTGTPAFFMHPGEASHGDLGMITAKDVIIAISFSGGTVEVLNVLPYLDRIQVPLISISRAGSALALAANINLDVGFVVEACPLALAPTSSTTVSLVLGDALAISVSTARGLTKENFSLFHPGGLLGKRLLLRVKDIMHSGARLPKVHEDVTLDEALIEITSKRLGMTTIVNEQGQLSGIFTDGDLRRALQNKTDIHQANIKDIMTIRCKTISSDLLAVAALDLMETHKITSLVILDEKSKPEGIIHIHDLLQLGLTQT
jgi:arabinose-5-phosphate isomerase